MTPGLLLILAEAFNTFSGDQIQGYLEAKDFEQALYLTRINSGLDSPNQIPILNELIRENPEYLYLLVNVCERAYGRGAGETISALIRLSNYITASYTDPITLLKLLERFRREAEDEAGQIELLIGRAEIAGELIRFHYYSPLTNYRDTLNSSLYTAQDQREMEVSRAYLMARRALDEAERLLPNHPEKISRFNEVVSRINSIPR